MFTDFTLRTFDQMPKDIFEAFPDQTVDFQELQPPCMKVNNLFFNFQLGSRRYLRLPKS